MLKPSRLIAHPPFRREPLTRSVPGRRAMKVDDAPRGLPAPARDVCALQSRTVNGNHMHELPDSKPAARRPRLAIHRAKLVQSRGQPGAGRWADLPSQPDKFHLPSPRLEAERGIAWLPHSPTSDCTTSAMAPTIPTPNRSTCTRQPALRHSLPKTPLHMRKQWSTAKEAPYFHHGPALLESIFLA